MTTLVSIALLMCCSFVVRRVAKSGIKELFQEFNLNSVVCLPSCFCICNSSICIDSLHLTFIISFNLSWLFFTRVLFPSLGWLGVSGRSRLWWCLFPYAIALSALICFHFLCIANQVTFWRTLKGERNCIISAIYKSCADLRCETSHSPDCPKPTLENIRGEKK